MKLSAHFHLDELTISAAAARAGIDNIPDTRMIETLRYTAERMEEVRMALADKPISILSGYRCPAVNRLVGGAAASAHMTGYAVDFICPAAGTPQDITRRLAASGIEFDQIIQEFGRWVHISFAPEKRRDLLDARKVDGKTVYVRWRL